MLAVSATGATTYQWRFNDTIIAGATNATLQLASAQIDSVGYYVAIAQNAAGSVPSHMVWLSVMGATRGVVPLSNVANSHAYAGLGQAFGVATGQPITGSAQVLAGPALDQMAVVTGTFNKTPVTNGWFDAMAFGPDLNLTNKYISLPTAAPGQTCYYSVLITYTNSGTVYTQPSTVLSLVAGGDAYPIPSTTNLLFPAWLEWPEPLLNNFGATSSRIPIAVPTETIVMRNYYEAYTDLGAPHGQWRKNGKLIVGATNYVQGPYMSGTATLTLTNVQPSDAGVYDFVLYGNNWMIADKIYLSVLNTGQGIFQNPRMLNGQMVCDLVGAAGRTYRVLRSTNLVDWGVRYTLSNATGTVTFTNPLASSGAPYEFYRTVLLPQ
jgi:hypothetical protein